MNSSMLLFTFEDTVKVQEETVLYTSRYNPKITKFILGMTTSYAIKCISFIYQSCSCQN